MKMALQLEENDYEKISENFEQEVSGLYPCDFLLFPC